MYKFFLFFLFSFFPKWIFASVQPLNFNHPRWVGILGALVLINASYINPIVGLGTSLQLQEEIYMF